MSIKENTRRMNVFEEYLKNIKKYPISSSIKDMKEMSKQFNISILPTTTKLELNNIYRFNKIIDISNKSIQEFKNLSPNDSSGNFIGPNNFIEKINGLNENIKSYFKYNYDVLQNEIKQLEIIPIIEKIISQKAYENINKSIKILETNSHNLNDVIIEGEQILKMYKKAHELLIKGDKLFGIINRFIELLNLKIQFEPLHIEIDLTSSINEKWKNLQYLTIKVLPKKEEDKTNLDIVKTWIELNILILKKEISKSNYTEESNLRRILNDTEQELYKKEEKGRNFASKIDGIKKRKEGLTTGQKLSSDDQSFLNNSQKMKDYIDKDIEYVKASQKFYNDQITNLSTDKISLSLREFKNNILHIINIKDKIELLEQDILLLSIDIHNLKTSSELREIEENIRNPKHVPSNNLQKKYLKYKIKYLALKKLANL